MRLWAIALLVAACGQDTPDGHQRMLDLLVKVRDDTAETNIWLGDKRARDLRYISDMIVNVQTGTANRIEYWDSHGVPDESHAKRRGFIDAGRLTKGR